MSETVERIVAPSGGDDTAAIQSAIDAASRRPVKETGFRGAVELGPGKYRISNTLKVRASGVVLRGAGMDRTQLNATGSLDMLILVEGSGTPRRTGNSRRIMANYVPVGGKTILLDSAADLSVGNRVFVQRPMTRPWISAVGMDRIPARSNGKTSQWAPGASILSDRTIVRNPRQYDRVGYRPDRLDLVAGRRAGMAVSVRGPHRAGWCGITICSPG